MRNQRRRVVRLVGALVFVAAGSFAARWSAAEESMAYLQLTDGYWQIWRMDLDGSNAQALTTTPGDKHSIAWCPGNAVIHFYDEVGVSTLVDVQTGKVESQARLPVPGPIGPNGQRLGFDLDVRARLLRDGVVKLDALRCDATSEVTEILGSDDSSDNAAVAVQRQVDSNGRVRVELKAVSLSDVSDLETLSSGARIARAERVVSKHGSLGIVRQSGGVRALSARELTGEESAQLTSHDTLRSATWAPSGDWLVVDSEFEGHRQIYRVNETDGQVTRLTDGTAPAKGAVFSLPEATPEVEP